MATEKYLARDYDFELNTGTVAVPVWTQVLGLDTWGHSPTKNNADTTTFENEGDQTHLPASRTHSFSITGKKLVDTANGNRDPGQEACEAWGLLMGNAGLKQFRITPDAVVGGDVIGPFMASATVTVGGGGNDDADKWELALDVSGRLNP